MLRVTGGMRLASNSLLGCACSQQVTLLPEMAQHVSYQWAPARVHSITHADS